MFHNKSGPVQAVEGLHHTGPGTLTNTPARTGFRSRQYQRREWNGTLHATFKVEVADSEYSYQGQRGEAEMKIQVPRSVLENFDPDPLLAGVLSAALHNYDTKDEEDESG